jgi:hypothetical protein
LGAYKQVPQSIAKDLAKKREQEKKNKKP